MFNISYEGKIHEYMWMLPVMTFERNVKMKTRFLVLIMTMALAASSFTVSIADLTVGLAGYWPLDGDGNDESGNGLDGVLNGNVVPVEDRNGNANSAMQFPGVSTANFTIEDTPKLQFTDAMTLAAWVIVDSAMKGANNGRIISKMAGGGARSWSLNIENATLPATFQISTDGAGILEAGDKDSMPTDEWAHIAGVFRPGESLEVYVNGVLKAENKTGIPDEQFSDNGQLMYKQN